MRQFGGLGTGFVIGWLIGFGLEYAVGARLVTGSASNPFSVAFGLPLALAVACGLFRLMLGTAGKVEVVDAPGADGPVPPPGTRRDQRTRSAAGLTGAPAHAVRPSAQLDRVSAAGYRLTLAATRHPGRG
jgi:hypothetical protein